MEWLDRFVSIMNLISETAGAGMGLTELARVTGLSKGTLHRMLSNMVAHNLIIQNPDTKKYRLGPKALVWGSRFISGQDSSVLLSRYCDLLAERTKLYTFLCRIDNDEVYCIYTRQPNQVGKRYFVHVGQRMPLYSTAAAKAVLAFLSDSQLNYLLAHHPPQKFTEHTKLDKEQILAELEAVREKQIAFCIEELESGVSAIATPVFLGNHSRALYSITLISDAKLIREQGKFLVDELLRVGKEASEYMSTVYSLTSVKGEKYGAKIPARNHVIKHT